MLAPNLCDVVFINYQLITLITSGVPREQRRREGGWGGCHKAIIVADHCGTDLNFALARNCYVISNSCLREVDMM